MTYSIPTSQQTLLCKGFTLVELLVVLGLFSSIATLVLGALFNTQAINVRLQETQAILDNVNLSTQTITRDIRFGSDFYGTTTLPELMSSIPTVRRSCPESIGGCSVLVFKPAETSNDLDRVVYYLKQGILYKEERPYGGTPALLQMTASDVTIDSLKFYVKGAQTADGSNDENAATDYEQSIIMLLISGYSKATGSTKSPVTFNIQTSISAREIDNK
jgi:prepilin-type N-terminal cleavage/methylation domain-containing protein